MNVLSATRTCSACRDGVSLFPFTMAFQPIVNVSNQTVYAYEALARGPLGESALSVLGQVNDENRYAFDQACRVKAITLASQLGLVDTGAQLSINFLPNAIYSPEACLRLTLNTARQVGFPVDRLIFEFTEQEKVMDVGHLHAIIAEYHRQGFKIAIDDFGAGFSGLSLLSGYTPDILKLDMSLIRGVNYRRSAQVIVRHIVNLAHSLSCDVVAEGIETVEECCAVQACGVHLMQGYLFARPALERLPEISFPNTFNPANESASAA